MSTDVSFRKDDDGRILCWPGVDAGLQKTSSVKHDDDPEERALTVLPAQPGWSVQEMSILSRTGDRAQEQMHFAGDSAGVSAAVGNLTFDPRSPI
jgi:hypothetical protein